MNNLNIIALLEDDGHNDHNNRMKVLYVMLNELERPLPKLNELEVE